MEQPKNPAKWTLIGFAIASALLAVEATLNVLDIPASPNEFRFVTPDFKVNEVFNEFGAQMIPDNELFWKMDPEFPGTDANYLGLRGKLPEGEKNENTVRLVCIGDSCTFGAGVSLEESYAHQLKQKLLQENADLEVEPILAAMVGYSTYQNRLLIEKHVSEWNPDISILYCGAWNDGLPAVRQSDHVRGKILAQTRIAQLIRNTLQRQNPIDFERIAAGEAPDGRRVPLVAFRENLETMIDLCQASSKSIVLIVPPLPEPTATKYPILKEYQTTVMEVAKTRDLAHVNAHQLFKEYSSKTGEQLFIDWVHPNASGHELLAKAVANVIHSRNKP
ncbi:MAG: hypothetical protein CMI18_12085 [Opitutaceae bacterium]|nr:hypothetical protein [Opitutaceae bacterium]